DPYLYNFKNTNKDKLRQALSDTDSSVLKDCSDVNLESNLFYKAIYNILDIHVPKSKSCRLKYPIWLSTHIKRTLRQKFFYRRQFKKYHRNEDLLRKSLKFDIEFAYKNYVRDIENNISNCPQKFWHYLRMKKKKILEYPQICVTESILYLVLMILSRMDYVGIVWFPHSFSYLNQLGLQRKFLKYLSYREDGVY
ncbi:hypothetical protein BDFB_011068, partial [Asbolus verrucosus]